MKPERERLVLRDVRAVLPEGCAGDPVSVAIEGGRIAEIGGVEMRPGDDVLEGRGRWLLPGLIDLQVNDIEWLAGGLKDPLEHASRIRRVLEHQAARGITGLVLATLAAPIEEVLAYLAGMGRVLRERGGNHDGVLLGGLVEGTFMNPELHGAHNPEWVLAPDRALVDRFLETGALRLLNVAPERSPEALDVIRHAAERGVVVGCGHAKPHAECLRRAADAGLRYIIHLGNGPTGTSLKRFHDGGMLEEALRNDRLAVTIIIDGWHVHPELVRDWIARKEVRRVIGVSDAGFAMGPPAGPFEVFGIRGDVAEGGRYLYVRPPPERPPANPLASDAVFLFGSAIDQRDVFENTLNLLTSSMAGVSHRWHEALPLEDALHAAAGISSANPARLLGLADRGRLEPGARADLVLARIEGAAGAYRVEVERTFLGG